MRKNVANQKIAAQLVATADGSAVTSGTTTVYLTIDGGTQNSIGTATHEGQGCWTIDTGVAGNTNGDHLAFTFVNSSAISVTVNVYTISYDPHDTVRLGITALPNAAADAAGGLPISDAGGLDLDAILADTNELQTNQGNWLTATTVDLNADQSSVTIGTVTTLTNTVTLADGAHGGSSASFAFGAGGTVSNASGSALTLTSSGGNGHGFECIGNGSGEGISATGGATGHGIAAVGTGGAGIYAVAYGANSYGMYLLGLGATDSGGLLALAGTAGEGIECVSAGNGHGLLCVGSGSGEGLHCTAGGGANAHGAHFEGAGANSHGLFLSRGGAGGDDLKFANNDCTIPTVTTVTTVTTLTGHTPQTGDTYALANGASGFVATKTIADAILVDTGTTLPGTLTTMEYKIDTVDTVVDTILVDTNELQTDWTNGGRLDLILDAIVDDTGSSGVVIAAASVNTVADAILARAVSNVEDTADKHSLGALVIIATNASVSGTTLTAKKPSDDSTFQTYTLATTAGADPVTGVS